MKLTFSWRIFENIQISNFVKIRPEGAELFHVDGQTDMTKLIVTFRDYTKGTNNVSKSLWLNMLIQDTIKVRTARKH